MVRANIGHRPIRELPRSQRFTQEKEEVLVERIVIEGLVEALDPGARTFEHLGKIGITEEKRSGDLGGLVVRRETSRINSICSRAKSGSSLKSDVLA